MKYAGLTDDLDTRKEAHNNPSDWKHERSFKTEDEARKWESDMSKAGYRANPGGTGWRYGYTYTITPQTKQS